MEFGNRSKSGLAYYEENPAAAQAAVVLLHGIPGSGAGWAEVADVLSASHHVIVPDLLGFGASDRPTSLEEIHAAAQAGALAGLLDEISIGPVVIAAHDFGGPVALALHARRPELVAGVALLATNTFTDTPIPFPLNTVTWPVVGRALAGALFSRPSLGMMLRSGVGRPRIRLDPSTHLGDAGQSRSIRTIFHGSLARIEELYRPIEDQLSKLSVPTTVMWGDRDPFFSVEQGERTAAAARASFNLYPGAGHFLPQERPAEVAADLATLIAVVTGA